MLDFVAAARVSRRVELSVLRLTTVLLAAKDVAGTNLDYSGVQHKIPRREVTPEGRIEVECAYKFTFASEGNADLDLLLSYFLVYSLHGDEPVDDNDLQHFADANGRYHSWPFAREMVASLTSKMGGAPCILPALSFNPRADDADDDSGDEVDGGETDSTEQVTAKKPDSGNLPTRR